MGCRRPLPGQERLLWKFERLSSNPQHPSKKWARRQKQIRLAFLTTVHSGWLEEPRIGTRTPSPARCLHPLCNLGGLGKRAGRGLGARVPVVWRHNLPPQSRPLATSLETVSVALKPPRVSLPKSPRQGLGPGKNRGVTERPLEGCRSTKHGWQPER